MHSSWEPIFQSIEDDIRTILRSLAHEELAPPLEMIFAAFQGELADIRCVIVGQDPYPTVGNAMGLAFSVNASVKTIPASLRNILVELNQDQGIPIPRNGDLSPWAGRGVLLLNRVLTTRVGESNAHIDCGWQKITGHIALELGRRNVVGLLWGKQAQEVAQYFPLRVEGVHPSPLSSYRGFFGSQPFSRVNEILKDSGQEPIDWSL